MNTEHGWIQLSQGGLIQCELLPIPFHYVRDNSYTFAENGIVNCEVE